MLTRGPKARASSSTWTRVAKRHDSTRKCVGHVAVCTLWRRREWLVRNRIVRVNRSRTLFLKSTIFNLLAFLINSRSIVGQRDLIKSRWPTILRELIKKASKLKMVDFKNRVRLLLTRTIRFRTSHSRRRHSVHTATWPTHFRVESWRFATRVQVEDEARAFGPRVNIKHPWVCPTHNYQRILCKYSP